MCISPSQSYTARMNSDQKELFLTRVDVGGGKLGSISSHRELLSQVRKEHIKIQEVVDAFRSKVDRMVDKQRQEYVSAYEAHIQDVQKELHQLREKANQIANDHTKNERTEKLKADLNHYKNEALQLETDSDEVRIEMAHLVKQVYSVEKYRDWMLKKLRQAKAKYNYLVKERARIVDDQNSLSNASSYTIELKTAERSNQSEIQKRFDRSMQVQAMVHRQPTSHSLLPKIDKPGPSRITSSWDVLESIERRKSYQGDTKNQNALAELIAARARREEMLEFVSTCRSGLHRRPFCKIDKRPLNELIDEAEKRCQHYRNTDAGHWGDDQANLSLACELAASPEVYELLRKIISEHHHQIAHRNSPTNKSKDNILGTSFAADDDEFISDPLGEHFVDENDNQAIYTPSGDIAAVGISLANLDMFMPKL